MAPIERPVTSGHVRHVRHVSSLGIDPQVWIDYCCWAAADGSSRGVRRSRGERGAIARGGRSSEVVGVQGDPARPVVRKSRRTEERRDRQRVRTGSGRRCRLFLSGDFRCTGADRSWSAIGTQNCGLPLDRSAHPVVRNPERSVSVGDLVLGPILTIPRKSNQHLFVIA